MSLIRLIYKGHCGFIRVTLSCPVCLSLSLISCFGRSQEPEPCGEDPSFTSESLGGSLIWFHRRESAREGKRKKISYLQYFPLDCFLFSFLFFFFFVVVVALGLHSSMQVLSLWHGLNCPATCRI